MSPNAAAPRDVPSQSDLACSPEKLMKSKFLLLIVSAALPLTAVAEKLNIRTGTWEITATTQMSGAPAPPPELLEKMTPQQRAEIVAAYKAEAAKGPQTEVTRECITTEDVEQPFKSAGAEDCTQEIVRTTRTTQEARLVCTGAYQGSGVLRVTAPNPEAMTASLDLRAGEGRDQMTIKAQMQGRWLAEDCEDEDAYDEDLDDEGDTPAPDEYDEPEDEQ
jgi:hypothetical protein